MLTAGTLGPLTLFIQPENSNAGPSPAVLSCKIKSSKDRFLLRREKWVVIESETETNGTSGKKDSLEEWPLPLCPTGPHQPLSVRGLVLDSCSN